MTILEACLLALVVALAVVCVIFFSEIRLLHKKSNQLRSDIAGMDSSVLTMRRDINNIRLVENRTQAVAADTVARSLDGCSIQGPPSPESRLYDTISRLEMDLIRRFIALERYIGVKPTFHGPKGPEITYEDTEKTPVQQASSS